MNEGLSHSTHWKLEKRRVWEPAPYEVSEWDGNLSLNEGLNLVASLICGGAGTAYAEANTYIGVGDSSTAAAASQTALQAATNKFWQVMDTGYPTYGTSQQIVFKATFADGDAEFAWNEYTVSNAATDAGVNLLRKVGSKGTKASGEEWALTITYTLS